MKTSRKLAVAVLLMTACGPLRAGEIIDRIVATVNGHAILLSDCDEALRYEALVNGKPLEGITPADRRAVLERLVDQELLREQMEGLAYQHVSPAEVQQQVGQLRAQLGAATDEAWRALLARYGFTAEDLASRVAAQLDTLRFLDLRLRPSVHIDRDSVATYYREKFLPELRKSGAGDVPLPEVSRKIEELLAQQRMDELLNDWIRSLRQQSRIRELPMPGPPGGSGGGRDLR
jgi:hypothetical protein